MNHLRTASPVSENEFGSYDASVSASAWQHRGLDHIWMPYSQMKTAPIPTAVDHTEGVYLHLCDGRSLIDGMASWWSACHGYNHPHIVAAMKQQIEAMPHVMFGGINHRPALDLASRLADLLPGDLNRVFFSDSGSVAVEVAMKMALQFYRNRGEKQRSQFLSFSNAYHGDTTGAMSLCDPNRSMHATFGDGLLSQLHCDLPADDASTERFESLVRDHHESLAAVFVEPLVQGAGGMRFHDAETLRRIDHCCKQHDILWVADELATGFGRTGSMFAIEQASINQDAAEQVPAEQNAVIPDIICLGKAMSAGMIGMAATVASQKVFDAFWSDDPSHALMHGPTFMANPLACATSLASLDLFESEPRLEQVAAIESQMRESLDRCREIPRVVDVRVKGAIGVLQVDRLDHVDRLRAEFCEQGVWLRPFGDCIYTTPPLTISPDQLEQVTDAMFSVTQRWSEWR